MTKRLFILFFIASTVLCSCRKINLYPVFQNNDDTVFLIEDKDSHYADSLLNAAHALTYVADSLWDIADSLDNIADSPLEVADSLYHICDSLYNVRESLWDEYYDHLGKKKVNVLPADSCTVFVPFMYARSTKSLFSIYDCHALKGRARDGETVLGGCTEDRYVFLGYSGLDSLDYKYIPHLILIPTPQNPYYIMLSIPENPSPSSRTIDFEYSYQTQAILNNWSEWIYISSIEQKGKE